MPYITTKLKPKSRQQISLETLLYSNVNKHSRLEKEDTYNTRTYFLREITENQRSQHDTWGELNRLKRFNETYDHLLDVPDMKVHYNHFEIREKKKIKGDKTGKLFKIKNRPIDSPLEELKEAQIELRKILEQIMPVNYHTAAFAYVERRSPVMCNKRHLLNNSKWYLHLDFDNFFGSITIEFVMQQFSKIFPFSELLHYDEGREEFERAISLCFLNGGLPQGTPISPMLTNIIMIPVDYCIAKALRKYPKMIYTRYADDLIISSPQKFNKDEIIEEVKQVIRGFHAPLKLNENKTRFQSVNGSNWHLGVLINGNMELSIGREAEDELRAAIDQFMRNYNENLIWPVKKVQKLKGTISYYKNIEKDRVETLLKRYSEKHGRSVIGTMNQIIKGDVFSPVA